MRIAVFDSGIGGITVLHEALRRLPNESFVYFADTLHVPYGSKSAEEVRQCIEMSVKSLLREVEVKALVIACNTATSVAVRSLREQYRELPIIGMEPAVKPAVEMNRLTGKRVLVLATPLTLQLSHYHDLVSRVDDKSIVDSLPMPELVEHCEALHFNGDHMKEFFLSKFASYRMEEYGTIVLGCTHYTYYKKMLTDLLPHIRIVDGRQGTVARLEQVLQSQQLLAQDGDQDICWRCSGNEHAYIEKMQAALQAFSHMEEV